MKRIPPAPERSLSLDPFKLEYQHETAARLRAAARWSQQTLSVVPPQTDLHEGTSLANAWAIITVSYSGVEQSMKFLISQQNHSTVRDWRSSEEGKELGRSHGLRRLFDALDTEAKQVISEYYERFQSLHSYVTKRTVPTFLDEVSRGENGYGLWRYLLVEDDPSGPPLNSPDAMMAIWRGLVEIIEHRQERQRPVVMPDEDLWDMLKSDNPSLRNRMEQGDHRLNVCARMIWEEYRGIPQSEGVTTALRKWINDLNGRRDRNLVYLLQRARGLTGGGVGIRWDRARKRFEDVPWTLEVIEDDQKPDNSRSMDTDTRAGLRHAILRALYRSRFSVLERMLGERRGREEMRRGSDPKWQCTLHATKFVAHRECATLEVWENIGNPGLHAVMSKNFETSVDHRDWKIVKLLTSV